MFRLPAMDQENYHETVAAGLFSVCDLIAGFTLVVYDYILMFDKEQKYIWNAKWTPGKVLYLIVRYLPLVDLPLLPAAMSNSVSVSCEFASYWQMVFVAVSCCFADCVYGLRTWALWNKSRVIAGLIIACALGFNLAALLTLLAPS